MDLVVSSLADRPDLAGRLWDFDGLWPRFMQQDPVSDLFFARAATDYAAYTLIAVDADDPSRPNPVHVSVEHDHAVYVEPGVWVHHRI